MMDSFASFFLGDGVALFEFSSPLSRFIVLSLDGSKEVSSDDTGYNSDSCVPSSFVGVGILIAVESSTHPGPREGYLLKVS